MPKDLFTDSQCLTIYFINKSPATTTRFALNFSVTAQFWAIFLPDPDKLPTDLEQIFPYPQRDGPPRKIVKQGRPTS